MDISRERGNNVPSNITSDSDGCSESSLQQTTISGRMQYAAQMLMGPRVLKLLAAHSPSPGNSLSFGTGTFVIEFHITGDGL